MKKQRSAAGAHPLLPQDSSWGQNEKVRRLLNDHPGQSQQNTDRGPSTCIYKQSFIGTQPNSFVCIIVYGGFHTTMAKLNSCRRPHGPPCIQSGSLRKSPREQADEPYPRSHCIFKLSNSEATGSHMPSEAQRVADKPSVTGPVCMMTTLRAV